MQVYDQAVAAEQRMGLLISWQRVWHLLESDLVVAFSSSDLASTGHVDAGKRACDVSQMDRYVNKNLSKKQC